VYAAEVSRRKMKLAFFDEVRLIASVVQSELTIMKANYLWAAGA
jgi:hypothetical protein